MMLLLFSFLTITSFCFSTELTGSEQHSFPENQYDFEAHRPLPYMINPPFMTGMERIHIPLSSPQKKTITVTKTIIIESTKHIYNQPLCLKANPGVPPCPANNNFFSPSQVLKTPEEEEGKVIGFLEKNKEFEHRRFPRLENKRHILPLNYFGHPIGEVKDLLISTRTVAETLHVTRVEKYTENLVTATLIPVNCVPFHEDIPPCQVKVEHYINNEKQKKPDKTDSNEENNEYTSSKKTAMNF